MNKGPNNTAVVAMFISLFFFNNTKAQTADSFMTRPIRGIEVKLLAGYWQAMDSSQSILEFIDTGSYQMVLDLKDGSHPYYFLKYKQDSVTSSGFYPNWPPFSCDLELIEPGILNIHFSQMGVTSISKRYVKRKAARL